MTKMTIQCPQMAKTFDLFTVSCLYHKKHSTKTEHSMIFCSRYDARCHIQTEEGHVEHAIFLDFEHSAVQALCKGHLVQKHL